MRKYIENILDLDSFGQVKILGSSSAGTSQRKLQEISTVVVESKGKEKEPDIQVIENFTMTEQPQTSQGQEQVRIPPTQLNEPEISILQTPLNVEKGKNREVESATPFGGSSEQQGVKRQKLTPLPEDESFQEIPDSQGTEDSQQTNTGSGTGIQRQQSAEISSFKPPVKTAWVIKRTFTNIKARNDALRLQVYSQYL